MRIHTHVNIHLFVCIQICMCIHIYIYMFISKLCTTRALPEMGGPSQDVRCPLASLDLLSCLQKPRHMVVEHICLSVIPGISHISVIPNWDFHPQGSLLTLPKADSCGASKQKPSHRWATPCNWPNRPGLRQELVLGKVGCALLTHHLRGRRGGR